MKSIFYFIFLAIMSVGKPDRLQDDMNESDEREYFILINDGSHHWITFLRILKHTYILKRMIICPGKPIFGC